MLHALVDYYEYLRMHHPSEVAQPGWASAKVCAFLEIDHEGNLVGVIPAVDTKRGDVRMVPKQVERTVAPVANLLCDTSSYLLGIDARGKPERALQCFSVSRKRHQEVLGGVVSGVAQAVCRFFDAWKPEEAMLNPVFVEHQELLTGGRNLVFVVDHKEVLDDEAIQGHVSENAFGDSDAALMTCLVSGEKKPIARLHPKIKLPGAQSSGAVLVGFNAPSFTSYGHDDDQGLNAPVGEYEAFAYTTALNYLLAERSHHTRIGDTTIVYWALRDDERCVETFNEVVLGGLSLPPLSSQAEENDEVIKEKTDPDAEVDAIMKAIKEGSMVDSVDLDAPFFVLGLSPNAARISVRFFYQDDFGEMMRNIARHYERLEIARAPYERRYPSVYRLVKEVENPHAQKHPASGILAGSLLRAILADGPYPASLFENVLLRIRSSQNDDEGHRKVTYGRAAIIKAYLIKNCKEDRAVNLDDNNNSLPYTWGRLFAAYERVQEKAAWLDERNLNTTIVDRYFNAACATPIVVFATLGKLNQAHLSKLHKKGQGGRDAKLVARLSDRIHHEGTRLPAQFTNEEQGDFILGYWCQRQAFFDAGKNVAANAATQEEEN